jgi:hypothetical protein
MFMPIADECKLNWRRAKLRQKTCIDESIMLPLSATPKRVTTFRPLPPTSTRLALFGDDCQ